jgi:hypothetical protein
MYTPTLAYFSLAPHPVSAQETGLYSKAPSPMGRRAPRRQETVYDFLSAGMRGLVSSEFQHLDSVFPPMIPQPGKSSKPSWPRPTTLFGAKSLTPNPLSLQERGL